MPAMKSAGGRVEVLAVPPTAKRLHQQYAGVHSSNLNAHTRELRLEVVSLIGRDFKVGDQPLLVTVLRLLQSLACRGYGGGLARAFLLQLAQCGQGVLDFLVGR